MKRVLYFFLGLFLVFGLAAIAAPFLIPNSTLLRLAADQVRQATGRELVVEGDFSRSVFPSLGVEASRVHLTNAPWASEPTMVSIDEARVYLKLWPLLFGDIEIEELRLMKPVVNLEVNSEGEANWEMKPPNDPAGAPNASAPGETAATESLAISLAQAEIVDGALSFIDRRSGQEIALADIAVAAALPAVDAPLTIDGAAMWNGAPAKVSGSIDSLAKIQSGEEILAALNLEAPGAKISFDGTTRAPTDDAAPSAKGDVTITLSGDPDETSWLRQSLPPEARALGEVDLNGTLDASEAALSADLNGTIDLNNRVTTIAGKASATDGWMTGAQPISLDVSAKNDLLDAGFAGVVAMPAAGAPTAQGDYRLVAENIPAILAWGGELSGGADGAQTETTPAENTQLERLESVDITGALDFNADGAAADIGGSVTFGGETVLVSGDVSGGPNWSAGGDLTTKGSLRSEDLVQADWNGKIAAPESGPTADMKVKFQSLKLRELIDLVGAGPIDAPSGALQQISTAFDLAYADNKATVTLDRFKLDRITATGVVSADLGGEKPTIEADLDTGPLDLAALTRGGASGGSTPAASAEAGGGGWSTDPLDLSALRTVDATFDVLAESVTTDTVKLGRTQIQGTLENGKLEATLNELSLYDGGAKGAATVDASGATPTIAAELDASAVQMLPFLRDVSGLEILEGVGRMRLDVAGDGGSLDALMRSLNGDGEVRFEDGAILGVNLAAMARNIGAAFANGAPGESRKTDFAELSGSFKIVDGVIDNPDLTLLGPLLRLNGEGRINLGEQTLDYRLTPKAVASLVGQGGSDRSGLSFPVLVSGAWTNPNFQPDLQGAIGGILEDPGGALEGLQGVVDGVRSGGNVDGGLEGAVGGALQNLGGGDDGADANPLGGLLRGAIGGGGSDAQEAPTQPSQPAPERPTRPQTPNPADAIRGLFGN